MTNEKINNEKLNRDFVDYETTQRDVEQMKGLTFAGNIRWSLGAVFTTKELQKKKRELDKLLAKKEK